MIIYILIFGTLNMMYGSKLLTKADDKRVQFGSLIIFIAALVAMILLAFVVANVKCVVYILLFCLVITIRVYYIKKSFLYTPK